VESELLRSNNFHHQATHGGWSPGWIDEYNTVRRHSTDQMLSPVDYEHHHAPTERLSTRALEASQRGDPGRDRPVVPCCCIITLEEDRSEVQRIAVRWQDVPGREQEAMLARLGAMLEYLDPTEDAEYQLRRDPVRLMRMIESSLGR
jgi:hypothetical protein